MTLPGFDPALLAGVPGQVEWSQPSTFETTRVHHGYRRAVVVDCRRLVLPELEWLVAPFEPVFTAWLSWIDPGGFIVRHRDAGPYRERWQLPVTGHGSFNGERPTPGVPFRVRHWEWHEVRNDDDGPRVSLVVDRDVLLEVPSMPFATYEEA